MSRGLEAHLVVRRPAGFSLDAALHVPPGRTLALLGPNGAGKTTTVAALAGLLPLDAGRITLDGRVLDDPEAGAFVVPERRRVGLVFQDALLFPTMTVLQNVAFGLRSRGMGADEAATRARAWLERTDLAGFADRRPGTLSGGQARRVALVRVLATEPALLLLDEPLASLDVRSRAAVRRLLGDHLRSFPGPRVLISHDPSDAFELADDVAILEDGRLTQTGSVEDVRLRPRTPWAAQLGGSNLLHGTAAEGTVATGGLTLAVADPDVRGPVRVSIRPSAISLHRDEPGGSPRNRWRTTVERVEGDGARVRLAVGPPLPLVVEITPAARDELGLAPGAPVWASVKATDIGVEAEPGDSPVHRW